jgi:hypothetical protein
MIGVRSPSSYCMLVSAVERALAAEGLASASREAVVLVDSVQPMQLNALAARESWDSLIAMLILTFPEITWVFATYTAVDDAAWHAISEYHSLRCFVSRAARDPLFDSTGLRDWVRSRTNDTLQAIDDFSLPVRLAAAAIDEERAYACLHAYAAYRFGYRADAISSWQLMLERFSGPGHHGYNILLEDMSLNFADRPESRDFHIVRLSQRAQRLPALDSISTEPTDRSDFRVLVTTGEAHSDDAVLAENRLYLHDKRHGKGTDVLKPVGGIFALWQQGGLLDARGFVWRQGPSSARRAPGHGTPGKLLLVIEELLRRATVSSERSGTLWDAVLGAVLATDALELSGGRTPTAAVDALRLKHRLEVDAECRFSGVAHHLAINARLDEVVGEVARISAAFATSHRDEGRLNAELSVLHGIVDVLRKHDRFDEEQRCMIRIRHQNHTLWGRRRFGKLLTPLLRYLELLLSSFRVFVAFIVLWVLVLSVLFAVSQGHAWYLLGPAVADAVSSFFSTGAPIANPSSNPAAGGGWGFVIVTCLSIVAGSVHLGVFISYLYSMLARK